MLHEYEVWEEQHGREPSIAETRASQPHENERPYCQGEHCEFLYDHGPALHQSRVLHSDESATRDADSKFRKHRFECPPAGGMKLPLKEQDGPLAALGRTTGHEFGLGATSQIGALVLRLDPRVLDDFGPFDNIGFDDGGEFHGRTNNRIETQLSKFFAYIG